MDRDKQYDLKAATGVGEAARNYAVTQQQTVYAVIGSAYGMYELLGIYFTRRKANIRLNALVEKLADDPFIRNAFTPEYASASYWIEEVRLDQDADIEIGS